MGLEQRSLCGSSSQPASGFSTGRVDSSQMGLEGALGKDWAVFGASAVSYHLSLNRKHWLVNPILLALCSLSLGTALYLVYLNTE